MKRSIKLKNWNTLEADENLILNTHYTPGRSGGSVKYVVVHHNAGNLTAQQIYNVWQTREASAHYQVAADGKISQHVWDSDTAWACGNWDANCNSISVEHADISTSPWTVSDATLDNGAHLVAALCKYYKLGRPQWNVNVFPHSHFSGTQCPASIAGSQNAAYMARAQAWYDKMTGTASAPSTAQPTQAATASSTVNVLQGIYRVDVDKLNVRDQPSLSGNVVATYSDGQTVNLDHWGIVADGYIWGRYTAYSGAIRYIALAPADKSTWYLAKA